MLNSKQQEVLLKPLNPSRVAKRSGGGKSLSYLEAWDVKAHLIRIFGFGGWSWDVLEAGMAFEEQTERGSWHVGYRVIGCLRIHDLTATYTEAAVGFATLPSRGEAHDMAVKTAESDALKRAAINLGDQFGLSLYKNGQTSAVVVQTLATGDLEEVPVDDEVNETASPIPASEPDEVVEGFVSALRTAMNDGDVAGILAIKSTISEAGMMDALHDGKTLAKIIDLAVAHAGKVSSGKAALTEISEEVSS